MDDEPGRSQPHGDSARAGAAAEDREPTGPAASAEDIELVEALNRGDEEAFRLVLTRYHAPLLRLALIQAPDRATAEDVLQETWTGLLESLCRFKGNCSLKTWLVRILMHCAANSRRREGHTVPFSALADTASMNEPVVEPERFFLSGHRWAGMWSWEPPAHMPASWDGIPEERMLSRETRRVIEDAIALLPPSQQEVITLRDVEGWSAQEACTALGLSDIHQRVLLHRARSRIRGTLERYLQAGEART